MVARGSPESLGESWPADISKARAAFRINIGDDLTDIETDDALVHEWAHMMTWAPYHPLSQDHDEVWGVWYARILRAYMRIN